MRLRVEGFDEGKRFRAEGLVRGSVLVSGL